MPESTATNAVSYITPVGTIRRSSPRISTRIANLAQDTSQTTSLNTCHRSSPRRTRGISLPQLVKELKPYLIGWRGYFGFCQTPRVLTNLEAWTRRRLRLSLAAMGERAQPLQGAAPSWRAKAPGRGCCRFTDGILAHVRTPGGPTGPAQPTLRVARSSPSLCLCLSLIRSNRRGT
ncbi:group II intron maturase-specific domain-containing protein [Mesorhizobium sp. L48C026A00]|uniref:group II intron maturase-specific domain-containing protein n=1 Tax=Mesorhizobium sp. L48C026A00 TaxID=1287182 RepID=UPI000A0ED44E